MQSRPSIMTRLSPMNVLGSPKVAAGSAQDERCQQRHCHRKFARTSGDVIGLAPPGLATGCPSVIISSAPTPTQTHCLSHLTRAVNLVSQSHHLFLVWHMLTNTCREINFPLNFQLHTHNRHHGVSSIEPGQAQPAFRFPPTNKSSVRRRLTSTSSLSATSTPASRPLPAVSIPVRTIAGYNDSQWNRLDLQVRWY